MHKLPNREAADKPVAAETLRAAKEPQPFSRQLYRDRGEAGTAYRMARAGRIRASHGGQVTMFVAELLQVASWLAGSWLHAHPDDCECGFCSEQRDVADLREDMTAVEYQCRLLHSSIDC